MQMKTAVVEIFTGKIADGNSEVFYNQTFEVRNGQQNLARIKGTLFFSGNFGGGTAKLQVTDGVTWYDITGVTLAVAGYKDVDIDGVAVRGVLTGAAGAVLNMLFIGGVDLVKKAV